MLFGNRASYTWISSVSVRATAYADIGCGCERRYVDNPSTCVDQVDCRVPVVVPAFSSDYAPLRDFKAVIIRQLGDVLAVYLGADVIVTADGLQQSPSQTATARRGQPACTRSRPWWNTAESTDEPFKWLHLNTRPLYGVLTIRHGS